MSGRFVRASKYRHVFGEPAKPDKQFSGIQAANSWEGNGVAVSKSLVAFIGSGGGGPVALLKRNSPGRINKYHAVLNVHKSGVLDLEFSPFLDRMIATSSDDGTAAVTVIADPDEIKEPIDTPAARLEGHQKKVHLLKYHPTANNVLATASYDNTVKIWDMEAQVAKCQFEAKDYPQCIEWNNNGSMLAATFKDKFVRIFDPRAAGTAVEAPTFPGTKGARVVWMESVNALCTFGFSSTGTRQFAVLDPRNLQAKGQTIDIDQGSSTMLLMFDNDNSVLYGAGKGDAKIMYWEAVGDAPFLHYLTEYRDTESTKGLGWLPKRLCDTTSCEIACAYRLTSKSIVVPTSFQVPRKSDLFQEDIFPDAYAGVPTQSAEQYFAGGNSEPAKMSMKPGSAAGGPAAAVAAHSFQASKSPAELQRELTAAQAKIAELTAENEHLKKKIAELGGHA